MSFEDDQNITLATDANELGFGMRLIELVTQPDGAWRVATRIALTNGSVVHRAVLAEGGYGSWKTSTSASVRRNV